MGCCNSIWHLIKAEHREQSVRPGGSSVLGQCVRRAQSMDSYDYMGPIANLEPTYYTRLVGERMKFQETSNHDQIAGSRIQPLQLGGVRRVRLELPNDIEVDQELPEGTAASIEYLLDNKRTVHNTSRTEAKGRLGLYGNVPDGVMAGIRATRVNDNLHQNTAGTGTLEITMRVPTIRMYYKDVVVPLEDRKQPYVREVIVGLKGKVRMSFDVAESKLRKRSGGSFHENLEGNNDGLGCGLGAASNSKVDMVHGPVAAQVKVEGHLPLKRSEMLGMSLEQIECYMEDKVHQISIGAIAQPELWQVLHVVVDEPAHKLQHGNECSVGGDFAPMIHVSTPLKSQTYHRVLVFGEVGVGKSMLVKQCTGQDVVVGRGCRGVTKHVREYIYDGGAGVGTVGFVDMPGAGDRDATLPGVFDELACLFPESSFSAVVFAVRANNPRFTIGQQYLSMILSRAFKSKEAWTENVIILGTHWDRVEDEDREETVAELRNLAILFAQEAKVAPVPAEQILVKSKESVQAFMACLFQVIGFSSVMLSMPNDGDYIDVLAETYYKGKSRDEVINIFHRDIRHSRTQQAIKRLEDAQSTGRLDALERVLAISKVIFAESTGACSEFESFERKAKEWRELYDRCSAKLKMMIATMSFSELDRTAREAEKLSASEHAEIQCLLNKAQDLRTTVACQSKEGSCDHGRSG